MQLHSSSLLNLSEDRATQKGRSAPLAEAADWETEDPIPCIRPSWSHRLASILQVPVGELLDVDGDSFAEFFAPLADRLPEPANIPERMALRSRLMEFALRAGYDFHTMHHAMAPGACSFLAIETAARVWFDAVKDPCTLLTDWASKYAEGFNRHHQSPPLKTARSLQQRYAEAPAIGQIARTVGASRSALAKGFKRMFGMTPVQYHTRVRLRHGLTVLRDPPVKVSDVATSAGYGSVKNFNWAVKHYTGLTPSHVRRLPAAEFERLLITHLEIDPARLTYRGRSSG